MTTDKTIWEVGAFDSDNQVKGSGILRALFLCKTAVTGWNSIASNAASIELKKVVTEEPTLRAALLVRLDHVQAEEAQSMQNGLVKRTLDDVRAARDLAPEDQKLSPTALHAKRIKEQLLQAPAA